MEVIKTLTLYCVNFVLVLLILNDQSSASEEGYKRAWRPQGRFGKRTLEVESGTNQGLDEDMTERKNNLLDSGMTLKLPINLNHSLKGQRPKFNI